MKHLSEALHPCFPCCLFFLGPCWQTFTNVNMWGMLNILSMKFPAPHCYSQHCRHFTDSKIYLKMPSQKLQVCRAEKSPAGDMPIPSSPGHLDTWTKTKNAPSAPPNRTMGPECAREGTQQPSLFLFKCSMGLSESSASKILK